MNRTLTAIAFVGIFAAGALLLPTAATPFSDDVDEIPDSDIALAPTDASNGVYAEIDDDGEIRLNLTEENQRIAGDGVNGDAVTEIDDVFTITYTGEGAATVWLTHGGDDRDSLRFYRGGDPLASIQGESNGVLLAANETVRVSVLIDTTDPDHGVEAIETFTVHAELPEEDPTPTPGDEPPGEETPEETPTPTETPDDGTPTETPTSEPTEAPSPDDGTPDDGSLSVAEADGSSEPTPTDEADAELLGQGSGSDGSGGGSPGQQLIGGPMGSLLWLLLLLLLLLALGLAAALRTNLS